MSLGERTYGVCILFFGCGLLPPVLAQPFPLDPMEFQVNSFTQLHQAGGGVARSRDGGFVVVWTSDGSPGTDSSGYSVQGRRFSAAGVPLGDQFQVNVYTTGYQFLPRVASDEDGNFIVVWSSRGSFGDDDLGYSVQARRFSASGSPLEPTEFQVNTYTAGSLYEQPSQFASDVVASAAGDFIVVWHSGGSAGSDENGLSVQARRFLSNGSPIDLEEFQVNTFTTDDQSHASVAISAAGEFVVVWSSWGSAGTDDWERSVQARRFSADGAPIDMAEFQVNTFTAYDQFGPAMSMDSHGGFVVVWNSDITTEGDVFGIQARRFGSDGIALDPVEFQVNRYTTLGQFFPIVARNGADDFVVAWSSVGSFGTDQDGASIQLRRFRSDGTPVDPVEVQANSFITGTQDLSRIAAGPLGDFILIWSSDGSFGSDDDLASVQARRYGRPVIAVTSSSGGTGGPGCTLRDAVAAASSGIEVGGCAAGNEGGVVQLPTAVSVRLDEIDNGLNGLPLVERPVTVRGAGSRIERDPGLACSAGPQFRLFEVASTGVLELEDVVVGNGCLPGAPGGAVLVDGGTLLLRSATIEGSESGGEGGGVAVFDGSFWATDSTVRGNFAGGTGGGVFIDGDPGWLRIDRSTVSENSGASGGGIASSGAVPATIRQSTVSGNTASSAGGGVLLGGPGAELSLQFSTLFGNAAIDGAGLSAGPGSVALHGSLVGESLVGTDCTAGSGTVEASGANLDTDGSCAALAGGGVGTVADLGLGSLADNGGRTRTHLPLAGSPAVDAAPACEVESGASLAADQRNYPRPTDDDGDGEPDCELGSVERGPIFLDGFEFADLRRWSAATL